MSYFDFDNIPDSFETVTPLPDDSFSDAARMFRAAQDAGLVKAREVKIAYLYDRKGYATLDDLAGHRNASYGKETDDVVVQLTIRIQQPTGGFAPLQNIKNILIEQNNEAARRKLEEELAALEIHKNSTDALIEEKKKKLSDLGVQ